MRLLLDTHVFLWALVDHRKLSREVRTSIDGAEVFISAASIWELAIKSALGRIDLDPVAALDAIEPTGFIHLPVTAAHAARVASLPPLHRDPFDRMLIAQAFFEPMRLVTHDAVVGAYGESIWII